MTWTIQPVDVGRRYADASVFTYLTDPGKEIQIAYRVWVLRGPAGVMLVDTGPPLGEAARRGITDVRDVDVALREVGVEPADVRTIVLTHLHWDHASNAEHFPNATFLAQEGEIRFFCACSQGHPSLTRFFSHQEYLRNLIDIGRIQPVRGDTQVVEGVSVIRVGGHTPGSQMVLVDTAEGLAVITGDAIPLQRNFIDDIPSGIVTDTLEAIAALERVRGLDPESIYTGHDLKPRLQPRNLNR
jgi:glyoxylase-like metal-dependent hydrolase (beta-lactamase superfamily II)